MSLLVGRSSLVSTAVVGNLDGFVGDGSLVSTDVTVDFAGVDHMDGSTGGDEGNSTLMPSLAPPQATIDTKAKVRIWETDFIFARLKQWY